jgi:hypothetical protein
VINQLKLAGVSNASRDLVYQQPNAGPLLCQFFENKRACGFGEIKMIFTSPALQKISDSTAQ